jgi:adenosylcobinamide-phosphate synthase
MYILQTVTGYILDLIIGDPRRPTHPAVLIGKTVSFFEKIAFRYFHSPLCQRLAGTVLAVIVPAGSYLTVRILIDGMSRIGTASGFFAAVWLISTTIGWKELRKEGKTIYDFLEKKDLNGARKRLQFIVGRDTRNLSVSEVTRAAVETIAENTVDGILSPLFYAFLGGAPLAMAYRAVNTLDSMVGHKNERYIHFGWASARLDDLLNFIPARICAVIMVAVSGIMGLNWENALEIMLRDARKHPSPNSGYPESTVAGALGVRLGGVNTYNGVPSFRAYLGEPLKDLTPDCILKTLDIAFYSSLLFVLGGAIIMRWLSWGF